jgi:hypothetical protein
VDLLRLLVHGFVSGFRHEVDVVTDFGVVDGFLEPIVDDLECLTVPTIYLA